MYFPRKYSAKVLTINLANKNVALIGAGRVGRSIMVSLVEAGYTPAAIISGSVNSAKSLADRVGTDSFGTGYDILTEDTDLIIIAVQDDRLENVVAKLASNLKFPHEPLIVHTSGIQESTIMESLLQKGAGIASIHPAASFPENKILPLKDVRFGVEGINAEEAVELVKSMGGIPFKIETGKKALYHAACTVASGYLNTLLTVSEELMVRAGVDSPKSIISDLAKTALNGWDETGFAAITGSIARGDVDSVRKHIGSLDKNDKNRAVYMELALKTIELCEGEGLIDEQTSLNMKGNLIPVTP